jgi:acetolactate synthase-1/2/3 large subunit
MRFDDRVTGKVETFAPGAQIIQVDIDPAEIGKNVAVDIPIVGDVKKVLTALIPNLKESLSRLPALATWEANRRTHLAQIAIWRQETQKMPWHGSGAWRDGALSADFVVQKIAEAGDHRAILVADVGQNQMWTARYGGFRYPYTHLSSGGLGTMGYGLPAAMGAALAQPGREVWAIVGDGGLQMTMQEMMTVVQEEIPLKIAVLDNHKLGMIRQWQELVYDGNYHSSHLLGPDWVALATAFGIKALRVQSPDEVEAAVASARAFDGPVLIDFEMAAEQNIFPMMPPGVGLSDLLEEDAELEA